MKKSRATWGFFWVVVASIIWGFSYVPQELIWYFDPLADMWDAGGTPLIEASMIVSCLQAFMIFLGLFIFWSCFNGKGTEVVKNLTHWPVSKWFIVSAFWGGLLAMFGSTLATAFIGADFSASIALLCAVSGAIYAKFLFKEKLNKKTIAGIIVLMIGGILVCDPEAIIQQMTGGGERDSWIGYIGGVMSAIGWGIESCYLMNSLDVADTEATAPVRYFWEFVLWMVIVFPITALIIGWNDFYGILIETVSNLNVFGLLLFTALSLGLADSLLHKGFPLTGVGRGLSLNSGIYVPCSLLTLWLFLKDYDISYWLIIGSVICIAGTIIMYWEKEEIEDSVREIEEA